MRILFGILMVSAFLALLLSFVVSVHNYNHPESATRLNDYLLSYALLVIVITYLCKEQINRG